MQTFIETESGAVSNNPKAQADEKSLLIHTYSPVNYFA